MSEPRFYVLEHSGYIAVSTGNRTTVEQTEYMVLDRDYNHKVMFSIVAPTVGGGLRAHKMRRARNRADAKCTELNAWHAEAMSA